MYLVFISVRTPEVWLTVEEAHTALATSAAENDGPQHAYLESSREELLFSLYMQAANLATAIVAAEQLSRRTIVVLLPNTPWSVRSVRLGF